MSNTPVALITGAAHRIGKALCLALHENNFNIAIHYNHSKTASLELCEHLNALRANSAQIFQADLTMQANINQLYSNVVSWQPALTVLINNASLFISDYEAMDHWDRLFNCNVKAPYHLSLLCADLLKKNKGCIINITDIHAVAPLKNYTVYGMTKAALHAQTQSLAKSLAPKVRVNAIAPGAILWPENQNEIDKSIKEKIINKTPLKTIGGTKPITQAALHFIENTFITGVSLSVDGGRHVNC